MMTGQSERQRVSVLLISNDEKPAYCSSLYIKGKRVEQCTFGYYEDRISLCEADVIVLDSGCEVWRGMLALRQIKQAHPDVPVIFLSDQSSDETVVSAMKLGAQEYYQKPVNVINLQQLVENLLAVRQSTGSDGVPAANMSLGKASTSRLKTTFSDKPQNILQVISFIESNLWSPMELGGLARKASLSKFHFCRVFKRYTGMNPMKYVNSLRIGRAKELLAGNKNSVSLVASEVGFRDLSNFIRQFKKNTGVTPTAYRQMSQSQNTPAAKTFADRQQATLEQ